MQVSTPVSAEQIRSLLITAQRGIGDARRSGINGDRSGTALIHPTRSIVSAALKVGCRAGRAVPVAEAEGPLWVSRKPMFKHEMLPIKEGLDGGNLIYRR